MDIQQEMRRLEEILAYHSRLYYELDSPTMQDEEYDALFRRKKKKKKAHPELASPNSPTQRVGGRVLDAFSKVRHTVPMDSFGDIFSEEEIYDFVDKIKKKELKH